ncbi:hypothetical protein ACFVZH_02535 [Streptomyces sp. NPDC059534]|uniref:hypothetical protein n=1 Tax=Streptomyces sp. NPDC059534 TaxID=3346859 RepID=UPI0036B23D6D
MTYEYRNPVNGDRIAAVPLDDDVWLKTTAKGCLVPPDRVEELVAGIRDAARTDAARQTPAAPAAKPVPCGQCGAPWSDSHGQPGDRCTPGNGQDGGERLAELETEIARLHDKHKASLQHADQVNNELMQEVQRYAEGADRPVLWSVYNQMHNRALAAEAKLAATVPAVGQPAEAQATDSARARLAALVGYEPGEQDAEFERRVDALIAASLHEAARRMENAGYDDDAVNFLDLLATRQTAEDETR